MDQIKILKQKRFKCIFCKGTGIRPGSVLKNKCPTCDGKGRFFLREPAIKCVYCKGKGLSASGYLSPCIICKGKGVIGIAGSFEICPECQGGGKKGGEGLSCYQCRGKGVIEKKGGITLGTEVWKEKKRKAVKKRRGIEEKVKKPKKIKKIKKRKLKTGNFEKKTTVLKKGLKEFKEEVRPKIEGIEEKVKETGEKIEEKIQEKTSWLKKLIKNLKRD